jgi:hypothetical protein
MVAVDDQGRSVKVRPLELASNLDKQLFEAGAMRRSLRKENMKKNAELHVEISKDDL